MLMQSVFRWPIESCFTSVKCSYSWTFFQLMLRYCFWGSVLISIYRLDALDLIKRKCACYKAIKKRLRLSMNSAIEPCFRNANKNLCKSSPWVDHWWCSAPAAWTPWPPPCLAMEESSLLTRHTDVQNHPGGTSGCSADLCEFWMYQLPKLGKQVLFIYFILL